MPAGLAAAMRARVASGQFANENDAVAAALEAAEDEATDIDAWLKDTVRQTHDAVVAGRMPLFTVEEVREKLGLTR